MVLTVHFQLNPRAEPFVPTATATVAETGKKERRPRVNTRLGPGMENGWADAGWDGRTRLARPKSQAGTGTWTGGKGSGKIKNNKSKQVTMETTRTKKLLARKRRRRGRARRRVKRREAESEREKVRRQELTIATHNVRTMAVDGKHGVGRAVEVLSEYQERDCAIVGLQEIRRSGQSALVEA